ncbi:hypothetical protein SEVIR_5G360566v4 [Setaria viridis]
MRSTVTLPPASDSGSLRQRTPENSHRCRGVSSLLGGPRRQWALPGPPSVTLSLGPACQGATTVSRTEPSPSPRGPSGEARKPPARQLCQRRRNSGAHHSPAPRFLLLLLPPLSLSHPPSSLPSSGDHHRHRRRRPPRPAATAAESGGAVVQGPPLLPDLPVRLLLLL